MKESTVDRRRRRRILRRDRWRNRWLSLLAVSSLLLGSWVVLSRLQKGGLHPVVADGARLSRSLQQSLSQSAQNLLQPPSQLPGSATAAPPRLVMQSNTLHYEDWVSLLRQEADAVAAKRLPDLSILAGDSLSLWFPENLLPADEPWLNQGISGETAVGLQKRLEDWQALQPRRIFLMIGINDLIRGAEPGFVVESNRQMIRTLRATHPEAEIILQSILPHSGPNATWEGKEKLRQVSMETIQQINRQLEAIAQAESVHYLDLYPLFRDGNGFLRQDLTTDGLHLNPQGYLVWSTALKMFEQQTLPQSQTPQSQTPQSQTPQSQTPQSQTPQPQTPQPQTLSGPQTLSDPQKLDWKHSELQPFEPQAIAPTSESRLD